MVNIVNLLNIVQKFLVTTVIYIMHNQTYEMQEKRHMIMNVNFQVARGLIKENRITAGNVKEIEKANMELKIMNPEIIRHAKEILGVV